MKLKILFIISILLSLSLVQAPLINNPRIPLVQSQIVDIQTAINYSTVNVNHSNTSDYATASGTANFWDSLNTPNDIVSMTNFYNRTDSNSMLFNELPIKTSANLVSWYRGDFSGSNFVDSKGSNNGVINGTLIQDDGVYGKSVKFDTTQFITLSNTGIPYGNNPRTLSLWFKTDDWNVGTSPNFYVTKQVFIDTISESPAVATGKLFTVVAEDNAISVGLGGHRLQTPANRLRSNQWYHVAVVVPNGATLSSDIIVYINGVNQTLTTKVGSVQTLDTESNGYWKIGESRTPTTITKYRGNLDEIQWYDRALTDSEIFELYQNGLMKDNLYITNLYVKESISSETGQFRNLLAGDSSQIGGVQFATKTQEINWLGLNISGTGLNIQTSPNDTTQTTRLSVQGAPATFSVIKTDGTANARHGGQYISGTQYQFLSVNDAGQIRRIPFYYTLSNNTWGYTYFNDYVSFLGGASLGPYFSGGAIYSVFAEYDEYTEMWGELYVYGDVYANNYYTLSNVASKNEERALDKLNNFEEWTKDGQIQYDKHYASELKTFKIKDGFEEVKEIVAEERFNFLTGENETIEVETIKQVPKYTEETRYVLNLENRTAEMEKMIWEKNQESKPLYSDKNEIIGTETDIIVTDLIVTKSKVIKAGVDYVSKFLDITKLNNKETHKNRIDLPNGRIGIDSEERWVDIEGAMYQHIKCLELNKKYEDYKVCMGFEK